MIRSEERIEEVKDKFDYVKSDGKRHFIESEDGEFSAQIRDITFQTIRGRLSLFKKEDGYKYYSYN